MCHCYVHILKIQTLPHIVMGWNCVRGSIRRTVHPRTGHEGPEREYRYSSTLSL